MLRGAPGWRRIRPARWRVGENRLVDGRRGYAEIPLHVGFGRRPPMEACVGVDERQIWPCLGVKSALRSPEFQFNCRKSSGPPTRRVR